MSDKIRMFIGTSSNGEDNPTEAVYEYTLRKNCSRDLEIVWMRQTNDPENFFYGFKTEQWPTPFSGYRWVIAEYCNFEGRAIYTDCDMLNFKDISELWDTNMKGKPLAARRGTRFGGHEFCVTLIDCARFGEVVKIPVSRQRKIAEFHQRCIRQFSGNDSLVQAIDSRWNCLDGEDRDISDIWQLHWTSMPTQPWAPAWFTGDIEEHPRKDLVDLFENTLIEANNEGYDGAGSEYPPIFYNIIGR